MKVITHWGQRSPKCVSHNPLDRSSVLFVHYSDSDGTGIDKKGEPKDALRNIQNFHMDSRGWCDIAYSYLIVQQRGIFKKPLIFKGRGFGTVPASQEGHNTGNVSVCIIADGNDRIKRSTVRAIGYLARRFPGEWVMGHRDVNSTSCPGDRLYSKVGALNRVAKGRKAQFLP